HEGQRRLRPLRSQRGLHEGLPRGVRSPRGRQPLSLHREPAREPARQGRGSGPPLPAPGALDRRLARGMSARLAGSVAVITGAASGMGAATARRFAQDGAAVLVVARDEAGARAVADEIAAAGGTAWPFLADVGAPSFAEAMVDEAFARFGRLDVLH